MAAAVAVPVRYSTPSSRSLIEAISVTRCLTVSWSAAMFRTSASASTAGRLLSNTGATFQRERKRNCASPRGCPDAWCSYGVCCEECRS